MSTIDKQKTYLAYLKNSVGAKLWRDLFTTDGKNITNAGEYSCAAFVSTILYMMGWIDGLHATVQATEKAILDFGWLAVDKPMPGDIIFWPNTGQGNEHIGFVLNDKEAVSNSSSLKKIVKHHITYNGKRHWRNLYRLSGIDD